MMVSINSQAEDKSFYVYNERVFMYIRAEQHATTTTNHHLTTRVMTTYVKQYAREMQTSIIYKIPRTFCVASPYIN